MRWFVGGAVLILTGALWFPLLIILGVGCLMVDAWHDQQAYNALLGGGEEK